MKNLIKRIFIITALLVFSGLLCACLPPNFSDEHKKSVEEQHANDAAEWFAANYPDATVRTTEAYTTSMDLLCAMKGKYTVDGEMYEYIYDYANNRMFVSKNYQQMLDYMKQYMAQEIGMPVDEIVLKCDGYKFVTKTDNDYPHGGQDSRDPDSEGVYSLYEDVMLFEANPAEYAKECVYEDLDLNYYVTANTSERKKFGSDFIEKFPNCSMIVFSYPISWDYNGVYSVSYSHVKTEERCIYIKDFTGNIRGGYLYSRSGYYDKIGNFVTDDEPHGFFEPKFETTGRKEYVLQVEEGTEPILFMRPSKKLHASSLGPVSSAKNVAVSSLSKSDCKEFKDYDEYYQDGKIILPETRLKGLTLFTSKSPADGKFYIFDKR